MTKNNNMLTFVILIFALVLTGAQLATAGTPDVQSERVVVSTDQTWVCDGPVDLDSVTVTMTPATSSERRDQDAVHLEPGCTGRIGRIDVTQSPPTA